MDPSLLHVSFLFVQRLLVFRSYFQSEPRIPSFQMWIVIISGIREKWLVIKRFRRNTQIIGSVQYSTGVVKKCSVCDLNDQNLGFEAQRPLIFEYHNWGDIMGMFTWICTRTYNFPHLSRTIIRYSINVSRWHILVYMYMYLFSQLGKITVNVNWNHQCVCIIRNQNRLSRSFPSQIHSPT